MLSIQLPFSLQLNNPFSCRSLIVTALLLLCLPFQAVSDTFTDVWRVLAKWNQYVREHETSLLGKTEPDRGTRFVPETATPFTEAAPQLDTSPQKPLASQELHPIATQGQCRKQACLPCGMKALHSVVCACCTWDQSHLLLQSVARSHVNLKFIYTFSLCGLAQCMSKML